MESHLRSICKAISWRVIAALITTSIAWGITHEAKIAACLGAADALVKLGIYYAHERMWASVKFGRYLSADYEI